MGRVGTTAVPVVVNAAQALEVNRHRYQRERPLTANRTSHMLVAHRHKEGVIVSDQTSWKHATFVSVGIGAIVGGALAIAGAIENSDGSTFLNVFLGSLGAALILFGVATAVASITTYLTNQR